MVAIAKPAPLTRQPMFPSRATYESPAADAYSSAGSFYSEAREFSFKARSSA